MGIKKTEKAQAEIVEQPVEEIKTNINCEKTLTELNIKSDCDTVEKIIKAFNYDTTFVAIILHESNFNDKAYNVNRNGSHDNGVFQENDKTWSYENRNLNQGLYYKDNDLDNSILIVKKCIKDNGLGCFAAYTNGSYKKHWDKAVKLIASVK